MFPWKEEKMYKPFFFLERCDFRNKYLKFLFLECSQYALIVGILSELEFGFSRTQVQSAFFLF